MQEAVSETLKRNDLKPVVNEPVVVEVRITLLEAAHDVMSPRALGHREL